MDQFVYLLPKVELHAHINGSISENTMRKLIEMKKMKDSTWNPSDNWEVVLSRGSRRTMADAFQAFKMVHELCDNDQAAYVVTKDVIKEFEADNVKYLELRTTPRAVSLTDMTKMSYVSTVLKAIKENHNDPKSDIIVKLLLAIDRRTTLEDAWDTLNLTEKLTNEAEFKDLIVGLDLSGDPYKGDATIFMPVFEAAKKKGFKLGLHLAEVEGKSEETEVLLRLPPDRIGHGTFLHPECEGTERLVQTIRQHNIPIEFCFTSNITTGTVKEPAGHHFGYWYNMNHACAICTDDKGVFATELSQEYLLAAQSFNLSTDDLWKLSYNSIDYIFADESVKETLRSKWTAFKDNALSST